jgi:RimJ/RimL family protein N-acetyltransferase
MFPTSFETERLRFERFSSDNVDARELYDLVSRRSNTIATETEYLPWDPVRTVADAAERIKRYERQWESRERAEWLIRPKPNEDGAGSVAGSTGLLFRWDRNCALPAIWLREPYWGRGYAGERADALLRIAFEELDLGVVAIPVHGENERSRRAVETYVERHGGRYEGRLRNHAARSDGPADHHRFSIARHEYEANRQS